MAKVDVKEVQDLLTRIAELEKSIETAGVAARAMLGDIKVAEVRNNVPLSANGALDAAAWSSRAEDEQGRLWQRLTQVRDSLQLAAGLDGPSDPTHIMYGAYASNLQIVASSLIGFALIAWLLIAIVDRWEGATATDFAVKVEGALSAMKSLDAAAAKDKDASEGLVAAERALSSARADGKKVAEQEFQKRRQEAAVQHAEREGLQVKASEAAVEAIRKISQTGVVRERMVLEMVILLGALGGALHLVGSLVKYVGNRQLKRSWLLYYLSTPVSGAALAPILYMLLRVGLLSPTGGSTGGSSIASLNLIAIYAFAALTGLFAKTATDKLAEVFKTAFRSSEAASKDPVGAERAPGAPAVSGSGAP